MDSKISWADKYVEKKRSVQDAIALIRPGQRIFIGSSCGEPQHLVRALSEAADNFKDLEIVRLLSLESAPLTLIANKTQDEALNIRSFYLGSVKSKSLARNKRFLTPINLSAVPRLFKSKLLPIHVALIQVSPPDDFGWMSLGVSVDVTMAAALSADLVIAQVNARMPRVLGRSFIHMNDVGVVIEHDEDILTVGWSPDLAAADVMAQLVKRLIEDGSTVQFDPGTTPQATFNAFSDKNDLGVHSQFMTNEIMHLYSMGVITNRKKGFNDGKMIASTAIGTTELYEFLHDNPAIEFHPSDYVNAPDIIARHNRMVAINVAMAVDLTGQVAADAFPYNLFSGATGVLDFTRGAFGSDGGQSFLLLPSTALRGKTSRIVPTLGDTAVVVPRSDVQYVATEFGVVNLFGKSFQERAVALISIAHPDFRDELFYEAKKMGLVGPESLLRESVHGVYPLNLEEAKEIDSENVTIRPARPIDTRNIQEHFYNLNKEDVVSRFFRERTRFEREEAEGLSQIDYIRELTLIAVVGEFGFEKVVGLGEYLLDSNKNMAEVAFSVNTEFQGKGLGKLFIKKLAMAARENGISGLYAYTDPRNERMIKLFNSLPYRVSSSFGGDLLRLSCRFDELNP
ncbi:GNAT family N-acetyltransferase [Thermodesulfobacteriota bacterium]